MSFYYNWFLQLD